MTTPQKPETSHSADAYIPRTAYPSPPGGRNARELPRITVLSPSFDAIEPVSRWLQRSGYPLTWLQLDTADPVQFAMHPPEAVLFHTRSPAVDLQRFSGMLAQRKSTVVLLTTREMAGALDFTAGFDDFVYPPYDPVEVETRLRFAVWRRHGIQFNDMILCGDLAIDLSNYEVRVRGEPVDLTLKEYELLKYLVTRRGRVFTREHLLAEVWGYDYYGGTRTVDVHVRRLRMKVERGGATYIHTVRGVGYKFGE